MWGRVENSNKHKLKEVSISAILLNWPVPLDASWWEKKGMKNNFESIIESYLILTFIQTPNIPQFMTTSQLATVIDVRTTIRLPLVANRWSDISSPLVRVENSVPVHIHQSHLQPVVEVRVRHLSLSIHLTPSLWGAPSVKIADLRRQK